MNASRSAVVSSSSLRARVGGATLAGRGELVGGHRQVGAVLVDHARELPVQPAHVVRGVDVAQLRDHQAVADRSFSSVAESSLAVDDVVMSLATR